MVSGRKGRRNSSMPATLEESNTLLNMSDYHFNDDSSDASLTRSERGTFSLLEESVNKLNLLNRQDNEEFRSSRRQSKPEINLNMAAVEGVKNHSSNKKFKLGSSMVIDDMSIDGKRSRR